MGGGSVSDESETRVDPREVEIAKWRRTSCVNTGEPCVCLKGSVAEAHCLTEKDERERLPPCS